MGVIGTYCQLCGLPTQHDHYVRSPGTQMMKIYRGDQPGGGHTFEAEEDVFVFGPEHEWLKACVAIPHDAALGPVEHGTVSDGVMQLATGAGAFVAEGAEDRYAFHHACWSALGSPSDLSTVTLSRGTHDWVLVDPFQQQLFEFQAYRDQGSACFLADPGRDPRSRHRIDRMAARAREAVPEPASTVAAVLALDHAWIGAMRGDAETRISAIYHYRSDVVPELERSGYGELLRIMKPYDASESAPPFGPQMAGFADFETALKAAVERDDAAILVFAGEGKGQAQYLVYAKSEPETRARIDALPGRDTPLPLEYSNEPDPEWKVYFEQMWPGRNR